MKKIITLLLALVIVLSLCACGKSEEVIKVEEMISAIGDVSLNSEDAINSAKIAYNLLPEKKQEKVENYATLLDAEQAYKALVREEEKRQAEEKARQEQIDTYKEEIEKCEKNMDLETLYNLCLELVELNPDKATLEMAQKYVDSIPYMCFAGTYLIQPEYIIGVELDYVDDSMMTGQDLQDDDDFVSATYHFSNDSKAQTAFKQYKEYIASMYSPLNSKSGWYDYTDEAGNCISLTYQTSREYFGLYIDKAFIDFDRIDFDILGNKPKYSINSPVLSIRNSEQILK